jgi:hypothetical protein
MEKICKECNLEKGIELFVKERNLCKECMKVYKKSYHLKNRENISSLKRKYYISNKENILDKRKENYSNNKQQKLEYQKEYASLNKEKISAYKMEYQRNRRKTDPVYKLKYVVGRMIRNSLKCKGLSKNKKSMDILGCSIEFFKTYIEEMFIDNMSWHNYGTYWDIDHIIPLSTAVTEEQVLKLNHYTNLQPLDSNVNRNIKRDKVDFYETFIPRKN